MKNELVVLYKRANEIGREKLNYHEKENFSPSMIKEKDFFQINEEGYSYNLRKFRKMKFTKTKESALEKLFLDLISGLQSKNEIKLVIREKIKKEFYEYIRLEDNLKGLSHKFIPTFNLAKDQVGEAEVIDSLNKRIKKNMIVTKWIQSDSGGGFDFSYETPAKIWAYEPNAYLEKNGILLMRDEICSLKQEIKNFKKDLIEDFLLRDNSPIIIQIQNIIKNTEYKNKENEERDKQKREFEEILNKEF